MTASIPVKSSVNTRNRLNTTSTRSMKISFELSVQGGSESSSDWNVRWTERLPATAFVRIGILNNQTRLSAAPLAAAVEGPR